MERVFWLLSGMDSSLMKGLMEEFYSTGKLRLPPGLHKTVSIMFLNKRKYIFDKMCFSFKTAHLHPTVLPRNNWLFLLALQSCLPFAPQCPYTSMCSC